LLDQGLFELIILIKPQFEAGREKVGKGGVVRDIDVHVEVLDKVVSFALTLKPMQVALTHSPIKGPMGNIEYLLHLRGGQNLSACDSHLDMLNAEQISQLAKDRANEAFAQLN